MTIRRKSYERSAHLPHGHKVYIYAIQCELFVKVGIAASVTSRLSQLRMSNPYQLKLIGKQAVPHEVAATAEVAAHLLLAKHHHRHEWFLCPPADALRAIRAAAASARAQFKAGIPEGPRAPELHAKAHAAFERAHAALKELFPTPQETGPGTCAKPHTERQKLL